MSYTGTVKSFNPEKGWGHIECPETHEHFGKDVFLLRGQLQGVTLVSKGDSVQFQLTDNGRGPEAVEVSVLSSAPRPTSFGARGAMDGGAFFRPSSMFQPMNGCQQLHGNGQHWGTVKSFNPDKGWGHIECEETQAVYGKDIFFMKSQLPGKAIGKGTPVRFSVVPGQKGPEATGIQPSAAPGGLPGAYGGAHCGACGGTYGSIAARGMPQQSNGQTFYGTVKSFNEERGWGHISCSQTHALYGKDIFVMRSALNGAAISQGDGLQFGVTMGMKGPEATNVRPVITDSERVFTGAVKMFVEEKGWGFIDCAESKQLYGKDIFMHRNQLGGYSPQPGEAVAFAVQISPEGRPEGVALTFGPAGAGSAYAPIAPGGFFLNRAAPF